MNLKTAVLRFSVDEKRFESAGTFWKRRGYKNHVIFLSKFSSNTNPKWQVTVAFSNFPTRVDGALVSLCGRRSIKNQQLLKGLVLANCAIKQGGT